MNTHAHTHANTQTLKRAHTYARERVRTHIYAHARARTRIAHSHIHTHAYTHVHVRAHINLFDIIVCCIWSSHKIHFLHLKTFLSALVLIHSNIACVFAVYRPMSVYIYIIGVRSYNWKVCIIEEYLYCWIMSKVCLYYWIISEVCLYYWRMSILSKYVYIVEVCQYYWGMYILMNYVWGISINKLGVKNSRVQLQSASDLPNVSSCKGPLLWVVCSK